MYLVQSGRISEKARTIANARKHAKALLNRFPYRDAIISKIISRGNYERKESIRVDYPYKNGKQVVKYTTKK